MGDRQRASDWLPPDLDAADTAQPDEEAGQPAAVPDAQNGGHEAEELLKRSDDSAERVKQALQASEGRGEKVDEHVRAAAAANAMEAIKDAEASARDAAEVAERMAGKVAELSERLVSRERELARLQEDTEAQQEAHQRELQELREEAERQRREAERRQQDAERRRQEAEAEAAKGAEERHQPREPAHMRQQTEAARLDLNSIGFDELCSFGLSIKQAARLIGYREQRGGFESPDDLDRLSGMPEQTIEALKHAAGG